MMERGWQDAMRGTARRGAVRRGAALQPRRAAFGVPACGHGSRALENIPVVSWLALRGKCSACGAAISARYPLVEIAGRLPRGRRDLAIRADLARRSPPARFLWTLLALTFIDFDTQLLPDDLTLPLLWAGLLANLFGLFVPLARRGHRRDRRLSRAVDVYWLFKLIRGKEGMGYGDFKLLAALGAWLGWQMLP